MNRRSFFKFLPVAPLALVAEGAKAHYSSGQPQHNELSVILGAVKPQAPNNTQTLCFPVTDLSREVTMAVGQDGRLWLRSKNDEWKRVVTE